MEAGFVWPAELGEEEGLIEIVDVNKKCLVAIKDCDRIGELSD